MFHTVPWRRRWTVAVTVCSLTIAACGSSGSSTTTTVAVTSTTTASGTTSSSTLGTRPSPSTTTGGQTTTTLAPSTTTSTTVPPAADFPNGVYGVVGCSNTDETIAGYTKLSSVDRFTTGGLGGGAITLWGDPASRRYGEYWSIYDAQRPPGGYVGAFVQLCIRTSEHLGAFDADEQGWVTHIVDQIHLRDPGIPVWVSGINSYDDGLVCSSIGPDGPAIAAAAADWAAANLPDTRRGPNLGPVTAAGLGIRDDCHPNDTGQAALGQQMVDFFDR